MNTKTLAAMLVCLTAIPAPAFALDLGVSVGASASASSSDSSSGLSLGIGANADIGVGVDGSNGETVDSITSASISANAASDAALALDSTDDLSRVMALIETSTWTDTSLSGLTEIDGTTYDVGAWITSENAAAFDLVLTDNADEIADLQAALTANASFDAWLEANNESASSVVAIGVVADGSLAVFTN